MKRRMLMLVLFGVLVGSVQAIIVQDLDFTGNPGDPLPAGWVDYYGGIDYDGVGALDLSVVGVDDAHILYTPDIGAGEFDLQVSFKDVLFSPQGGTWMDQGIYLTIYDGTDEIYIGLEGGFLDYGTLWFDAFSLSDTSGDNIATSYTAANIGEITNADYNVSWVEDTPGGAGTYTVDIVLNAGLATENTLSRSFASSAVTNTAANRQMNIVTYAYDGYFAGTAPLGASLDSLTIVPEPATLALLGLGGLLLRKRR